MKKVQKLRCWNGPGWGRKWVDGKMDPEFIDGFSVCARSVAEAVRLINKVSTGGYYTRHSFVEFASECWGNDMNGITPKIGVWVHRGCPTIKTEKVL